MTTPTPADLIRDLTHAIAAMNDVSPDRVRIDVAIDFAGSDEPEDDEVSSQPTSRARSRSADRLGPFTEGSGVQSVWQMFEAKGADAAFFHGLTVPSWKNPDAEGLSPVTLCSGFAVGAGKPASSTNGASCGRNS
jgi:hypothetical protein